MIDFTEKKVLVTGHSRGIGKAIYDKIASLNPRAIKGLSHDDVELASPETVYEEVKNLMLSNYNFDVCINCAGTNREDSVQTLPIEQLQRVMTVNAMAPFMITQLLCSDMKKRRYGRIVNIGSVFGVIGKPDRTAYCMSKHALIGLTQSSAIDLAPYNILVNCVSPGFVDTDMTRRMLTQSQISDAVKQVPMQRLGTPQEVAKLVAFLASDANTFITGQNIIIDGGFTIV